ncbi:MAG: Gfo/Idh/MocA family oxidoreductase [Chitinophagaceae bacterium]|nr:Gfo/Idh/MocA family oxidoreductase [Chitinophagaceae bacterium]
MHNSRREFIRKSGLSAAALTIGGVLPGFSAKSYKKIIGSNERIRIAVMGVNSRGTAHALSFSKFPNVEVAYLCDVEDGAIKKALDALKKINTNPAIKKDIRKLVAQTDFDAISVAAPDHWHAPAALLALAHGKHVYVEKPCSHNPSESELLIEAQKKYNKILQVGSQRRSFPTLIEAVEEVRGGIIGNAYYAKAWYTNDRKSIGTGKKIPVPPTLDFDLWQGPAPRKNYQDNLVHYNWHWFWNWGTGECCNNGNHEIDCCRWFLGVDFPTKVTSSGGRYAFKDDWQTPDTQIASFEFGKDKLISWEGRSCNKFTMDNYDRGFIIYGDKGTLLNDGGGAYKIFDSDNKLVKEISSAVKADASNIVSSTGDLDLHHFENFLESIRGNAQPSAPIIEGHKSVVLCHLANISQRTGAALHCNPVNGHIVDNAAAAGLWKREYEKGWEMKL